MCILRNCACLAEARTLQYMSQHSMAVTTSLAANFALLAFLEGMDPLQVSGAAQDGLLCIVVTSYCNSNHPPLSLGVPSQKQVRIRLWNFVKLFVYHRLNSFCYRFDTISFESHTGFCYKVARSAYCERSQFSAQIPLVTPF